MKISRQEMNRREGLAREFFQKNPEATVQELNDHFANRGEKRMGARAYTIRTEIRKEAKRTTGRAPITGRAAPMRIPRINAPTPSLTPPTGEADAKLAQEVNSILNDLARKIAGTKIQSILLNVSGEAPIVKLMELQPTEREVRLGETVSSLASRAPDRQPAPQASTPAPQGGTVTQLPTNGNNPQPPAGQ